MPIPFLTRYALVWHFPIKLMLKDDTPSMADFFAKMTGREDYNADRTPTYKEQAIVHWAAISSLDELPEDVKVSDVKPGSVRALGIIREVLPLTAGNIILHRQGHTWLVSEMRDGERQLRHFRGIVAGITRSKRKAEMWAATGKQDGITCIEAAPQEVAL